MNFPWPSFAKRWMQRCRSWRGARLTHAYKHLDLQMVKRMRAHGLPTWAQARHLSAFLSPQEKKIIIALASVIGASALVWAGFFANAHHTIKPARGGEYTEALIGSPAAINPLFSPLNQTDADLSKLIYSGLFRFDAHAALQNALADHYTVEDGGRTYHIYLKKDLKWSDGEPITSDDVAFTLERIQNTDTRSPLIWSFQNVTFNPISDFEFSLTLKEPYAPFINLLTMGILPQHIWEEITPENMRLSGINLKPVGAGPYEFGSLTKDASGNIVSYTLKPNEYFAGAAPYIKKITFKFYPNFKSALDALRTREADGLGGIPSAQLDNINQKTHTAFSFDLAQYTALFFNPVKQPILKDKNLRAALKYALSPQDIITNQLHGAASPVRGPLAADLTGTSEETPATTTTTLASAQDALEAAGWKQITPEERTTADRANQLKEWLRANPEPARARRATKKQKKAFANDLAAWQKKKQRAEDALSRTSSTSTAAQPFYRAKNNTPLAFSITTVRQEELQNVAEAVAARWRALGAEVTVVTVDASKLRTDVLKNKNYDVLLYGVILNADPDPFPVWHSSQIRPDGFNLAQFANKQADTILEKARATTDINERHALYQKFQSILDDETPAVFLYSPRYIYAITASLKGVEPLRMYTPDDRFNAVNEWYVSTAWGWKD